MSPLDRNSTTGAPTGIQRIRTSRNTPPKTNVGIIPTLLFARLSRRLADRKRLSNVLLQVCYGQIDEISLANLKRKQIYRGIEKYKVKILPNPSAKPSIILHATRAVMLPANKGVMNVAILHNSTLQISTFLAPNFVAQKLPES